MRKSYFILPLACAIIYLTTTSELPGTNLGSSISNCGQGGCHTGGTGSSTSITALTLTDQANSQVASGSYKPGHVYTVTFTGSNTANLPKFGFQLKASKGVYSAAGSGQSIVASTMLTHGSTAIAASNNVYTATATWTAPAAGSGTIQFTGIFNAVNGNGSQSGDMPGSAQTFTYTEATSTSVNNISSEQLSLFPNPANRDLHLKLSGTPAGSYSVNVYSMTGARVYTQNVQVLQGDQTLRLDLGAVAAGSYFLSFGNEAGRVVKAFVKQ